ncbi:hypothetical protein THUN1379_13270 [Paludibacterium sp. THUN1379]|uniref:hypothetical protein n=1 Tax=Paludibacterium sp. THUN1379 TaxID=3112107 RepID=UPI00309221D3|nr:hypothetical protein THUN1379_13270 [Paludibacterium sp. THUN1379]
MKRRLIPALLLAPCLQLAAAPLPAGWQDDMPTRVKALALLQSFNVTLLTQPSATRTLQQWCADHQLAPGARIVAVRDRTSAKAAGPQVRQALKVDGQTPLNYRRVQLHCGSKLLSEADNWYVPARLTSAMNHTLETSDLPFGTVVAPLHFSRRTLSATLLWQPLPPGWENQPWQTASSSQPLPVPQQLLQHQAVLYREDGKPFSFVQETYQRDVLAFPLN